jgi:hypothetical protein
MDHPNLKQGRWDIERAGHEMSRWKPMAMQWAAAGDLVGASLAAVDLDCSACAAWSSGAPAGDVDARSQWSGTAMRRNRVSPYAAILSGGSAPSWAAPSLD